VADGAVDYVALRASRAGLDAYLAGLQALDRAQYERLAREEQLALWINAYNAYAIALVLEYWPVASILEATPLVKRNVGGAFGLEFIPLGHLTGERTRSISLDHIEHEIVRKQFAEPRVHFALACAAKSCPALSDEPYRAPELDRQLEQAARRFLADTEKNRFDRQRRELVVSPIFEWNAADFEALAGAIGVFKRYGPEASVEALNAVKGPVPVRYSKYDWSLNGK
jgi:hypothetical protein